MAVDSANHLLIVGAGAAGLMAGRTLARAGRQVTIIEARERLGGRILTLPTEEFGFPAEGGAEFVHGEATETRAIVKDAGLALAPLEGRAWSARRGRLTADRPSFDHGDELHEALAALTADQPIADFLAAHFAAHEYEAMRRSITRMVEGYDAADPARASTFALRDEWMGEGIDEQHRIADGYGAMIDYLAGDARRHGATIRLGASVTAIDAADAGVRARIDGGETIAADGAILTVPLPLLAGIALPAAVRARATRAIAGIGFGNVVKLVLGFGSVWWARQGGMDLANLSFLFSEAKVPTWWTQFPQPYPVLVGWYAGPKADRVRDLSEAALIEMGIDSLADSFALPADTLRGQLVAARAINWGNDPLARGAYSYATPDTRRIQRELAEPDGSKIYFSGEAFYPGPDMGTVEAALAAGAATARRLIASD